MNIKLQLPRLTHLRPRITVVGVGGAGSNAVNNMIASGLTGVNFVVANTDAQSLAASSAEHRIQLGATLTEGLGAGAKPEVGRASAEEAIEELRAQVAGSHMVFVAAGMGGGTGTGAAGVIARVARECGALTVGVVTKPFHFEGTRRMRAAEAGIAALKPEVDTLIVIPNQNLFRIANERTTFAEAFVLADQVLYSGIACVVDLIVKEGLINLDFADVRTIMSGMGTAMMGTGEAAGERRAVMAAEEALSNPLLDDISLRGAKGLLVSITGGQDLKLYEVDEAAQRVRQEVDPDANIIVGANFDDTIADRIRVSIVASGMERLADHAPVWQPPPTAPGELAAPTQPQLLDTQPPFMEPYPEPYAQQPPASAAALTVQHAMAPSPMPTPLLVPQPTALHAVAPAPNGGAPYVQAPAYPYQEPAHAYQPAAAQPHALHQPGWSPAGQAEFTRVLTEALEPAGDGHPAYAALPPPSQPPAGAWASQTGAVFEEAPPQVSHTTDPLDALSHHAVAREAAPADHGFAPQAPADTRRQQRRVPEVEEFPVVGQRDYHAKAGQYGVPGQPATTAPAPRAFAAPSSEPPRKPGFFERLMGARRKAGSDARSSPRDPQYVDDGQYRRDSDRSAVRQRAPAGQRSAARADAEASELPPFFGVERK